MPASALPMHPVQGAYVQMPALAVHGDDDGEGQGRFGRGHAHREQSEKAAGFGIGQSPPRPAEAGEGHEVDQRRVHHQLQRHEGGDQVSARQQPVGADGEQRSGKDKTGCQVHGARPLSSRAIAMAPTMAASSTREISSKGIRNPSGPGSSRRRPRAFREAILSGPGAAPSAEAPLSARPARLASAPTTPKARAAQKTEAAILTGEGPGMRPPSSEVSNTAYRTKIMMPPMYTITCTRATISARNNMNRTAVHKSTPNRAKAARNRLRASTVTPASPSRAAQSA